jgi:hypothetical protein
MECNVYLANSVARDGKLYDFVTGEFIVHVILDFKASKSHIPVWCLLVTIGSLRDWDMETLTSETSQDYPDTPCALLLTEQQSSKRVIFQRVGISDYNFNEHPHWFDDAVIRAIDII